MIFVIKFIYSFLLPPGIFLVGLFLLSFYIWKKHRKVAVGVFGLTLCLYVFSTQWVGDVLVHSLETKYSPPKKVNGDVIVMLGGGSSWGVPDMTGEGQLSGYAANRLLTTARLQLATGLPVILSGGTGLGSQQSEAEIAKRQLVDLGIPDDKIIMEDKSLNTEQNAIFTKEIVMKDKFKHPILVTSAFHMNRSVKLFEREGMNVIPYPTDYQTSKEVPFNVNSLTPYSFQNTLIATKEYLGTWTLFIQ